MAPPAAPTMPEPDVVDLLIRQHALIRQLFLDTAEATGQRRRECADQLIRLLAVHETAEEEVVHPLARRAVPAGDSVVEDRLREEHDATVLLERLDGMDPDDPAFPALLDRIREAVLVHARHEERHEFNWLRQNCTPEQLKKAATAVRVAEKFAPTHPHAGTESASANLAAGPVLAFADRVRDAIRSQK